MFCIRCNLEKSKNQFSKKEIKKNIDCLCLKCIRKQYEEINKDIISKRHKEYYEANKEAINLRHNEYNDKNKEAKKEYDKIYREINKEKRKKQQNEYQKNRRKNDPVYKLRCYISRDINSILKNAGSNKNESCLKYLEYTAAQLKLHLESQFEWWMTWENWGRYIPSKWNDNDPSTWNWQLDHIIPKSDLPHKTMEEENFKICWALFNLRPLSAKQNNYDGVNKTRHIKGKIVI